MDSSKDFELSSDWDVVNTESSENSETSSNKTKDQKNTVLGCEEKDCSEDNQETFQGQRSGIEEVVEMDDIGRHTDSSDIDIIDAAGEISDSSSSISSLSDSAPPPRLLLQNAQERPYNAESGAHVGSQTPGTSTAPGANLRDRHASHLRIPAFLQFLWDVVSRFGAREIGLALLALSVTLKVTMPIIYMNAGKNDTQTVSQMKELIQNLENENKLLKSEVVAKTVDIKMFDTLEDLIKSLRNENSRLSGNLQNLIHHMEHQTKVYHKENTVKVDPYKKEIDKLKEQVNVLRNDNDDLQKQLVRWRYSSYGNGDRKPSKQPDSKPHEASSNITEEIRELRHQLITELQKIKEWEQSAFNLMEGMRREEGKKDPKQHSSHPKEGPENQEDTTHKSKYKHRRERKWSWKNIKKQLKGTYHSLRNINISEMIAVNKDQVRGALESVGQYVDKIQQEAKKLFTSFTSESKKEEETEKNIWDMLNKLLNLEEKGAEATESEEPASGGEEAEREEPKGDEGSYDMKTWFKENLQEFYDEPTVSWFIKRADDRAKIREDEEEDGLNWFLRKHRVDGVWRPASETEEEEE